MTQSSNNLKWRGIGQASEDRTMPDGFLSPIEGFDSSLHLQMSKNPEQKWFSKEKKHLESTLCWVYILKIISISLRQRQNNSFQNGSTYQLPFYTCKVSLL